MSVRSSETTIPRESAHSFSLRYNTRLSKSNLMSRIALVLAFCLISVLAQSQDFDFTVAKDGSGDFLTVQEAFDAVPDFRKNETRILLKPGLYKEKLVLASSKTNVALIGEDPKTTVVTPDDSAQKKNRF